MVWPSPRLAIETFGSHTSTAVGSRRTRPHLQKRKPLTETVKVSRFTFHAFTSRYANPCALLLQLQVLTLECFQKPHNRGPPAAYAGPDDAIWESLGTEMDDGAPSRAARSSGQDYGQPQLTKQAGKQVQAFQLQEGLQRPPGMYSFPSSVASLFQPYNTVCLSSDGRELVEDGAYSNSAVLSMHATAGPQLWSAAMGAPSRLPLTSPFVVGYETSGFPLPHEEQSLGGVAAGNGGKHRIMRGEGQGPAADSFQAAAEHYKKRPVPPGTACLSCKTAKVPITLLDCHSTSPCCFPTPSPMVLMHLSD